ncbi:MAG: GNAT family N-acetyltransferase, partial [bacterium]
EMITGDKTVDGDNITIRIAMEEDVPSLVTLLTQLTTMSRDTAVSTFRRLKLYPDYNVYIGLTQDRVVGTFGLMIMDNIGHNGAPIAVVENVVVDSGSRRQGIGRKMLTFAAATARQKQCYKMILASNVRLTESHQFYESLGFAKQGYAFSLDL